MDKRQVIEYKSFSLENFNLDWRSIQCKKFFGLLTLKKISVFIQFSIKYLPIHNILVFEELLKVFNLAYFIIVAVTDANSSFYSNF